MSLLRLAERPLIVLFSAMLGGCAATSTEAGFGDVATMVQARSGHTIAWNQDGEADAAVEKRISQLLQADLSVDQAVQIALVKNRSLQAIYEELSVAKADLVQAGLLTNPSLGLSLSVPIPAAPGVTLGGGIVQSFLDLFMIPARKTLASAEVERVKRKVGSAALDLAADVRAAYYTVQAAQQVLALRRRVVDTASASAEIARQRHGASNLSDLDFVNEQGYYEQVKLDAARSEADVLAGRERLTRLLGLWGAQTTWTIPSELPALPEKEPPLSDVESLAIAQRLDIAAARQQVQVNAYAFAISDSSFINAVDVGADAEVETSSGTGQAGPSLGLELPIFDSGDAEAARYEALFRQSRHRLAALATEARSQVRESRDRLLATRAVVQHYHDVLIPLRERIVTLSQEKYKATEIGLYELLQARQNEVNARREHIEATRDYWMARSELERAAGGRLPPVRAGAAAQPPVSASPPLSPSNPDDPIFSYRK